MGLTIHYGIESKSRTAKAAKATVEAMHALARGLPFDDVHDVIHLAGEAARWAEGDRSDPLSWLKIQAGKSVRYPWCPEGSYTSARVEPEEIIAFEIEVGDGSEWANVGLCRYPKTIEVEYDPEEDKRFFYREKDAREHIDLMKFWAWRDRQPEPNKTKTRKKIRTGLSGWRWGSFCKTQYASNPECGGLPNFLRCHVATVTLLERIGELPGVAVTISDEGRYGPANYSDDYREAYAEGRKPTYVAHPASHDIKALAECVSDDNAMIAAMHGALKDALGGAVESPIASYPDFERLEFRGSRDPNIGPFLEAMKAAAGASLAATE